MNNQKVMFKSEQELQKAILQEKARGTPDIEIGQKYGVTFRYIERLITKSYGLNISSLSVSKKIKALHPKDFKEEQTTVWSFKNRGNWATHSGEYRGNWSPYIPRNVIFKYSKPGEVVLDYFCGAGTTAVEAKLLGRKCIAFDINDAAIELAKRNVNFDIKESAQAFEPELFVGDARDLSFLGSNSIDLICAHPPYANILYYTDHKDGDLSFFDIDEFLKEMSIVAKESFRVLKPGRQCAILIGDTRRKKHVIPIGFKLIDVYLNAGFKLRELVIKRQHNCKTTGFWHENSIKYRFLLLAHEYLPIFEKPETQRSMVVKEESSDYTTIVPKTERTLGRTNVDGLESTTVWIFPEKEIEKQLNKNVIDRYSNGGGYLTISFSSLPKSKAGVTEPRGQKNKELLFIKSPFLKNSPSYSNIKFYLQEIKKIINRELSQINKDGFLIIQTQDVRINGYIEPLAKRLVEMLSLDNNLWLKEIVFVTQEGSNSKIQNSRDYLRIVHQHLLVYEVKK